MAAVSLFWYTNIADVTSPKTLYLLFVHYILFATQTFCITFVFNFSLVFQGVSRETEDNANQFLEGGRGVNKVYLTITLTQRP